MTIVTIKDVARAAGVSSATVSKVLTGNSPDYRVSKDTVERVRKAAEDLGYVPNVSAQNLRSKRSGLIGVVLNEFDSSGRSMHLKLDSQLDSIQTVHLTFDGALLSGLTEAARIHNSAFVVYPESTHPSEDVASRFLDGRVEGLILRTNPTTQHPLLSKLDPRRIKMMALWTQDVPPGVGFADIDHKGGAAQATEHLLSLGHTKIAFFGPGKDGPNAHFSLRHQGYLAALQKAGLAPDPELHTEDPQKIIQLHQAGRVTGVVGATDLQTIMLHGDLVQAGLKVPEDLSLVGFDNILGSEFIAGGLTTVHHPTQEMAAAAMNGVMALIRGETVSKCRTVVPTHMVIRKTTRAP
ncbi:LacI family DNA-binding transcriptional regulator [Deinococcus cellulosilyticus]|uniref:LacI family transcriptional regulator n=1 Tax=Deinococcus cellulosilyticus (strain DSM 18568 / NBRC 106333 / KACC 11606 / 5516J-15) TaxID=1223518 RepID=A0A511MVI3_DEIC1|nr:LacI family DNA-binding transcriptional regulator [Deinococcus cellulosilyticus]GEM44411.1 LacI family transcriptional regulator [Deinococcus cellulosilyticus NBRC 106333 = KACC 11606]